MRLLNTLDLHFEEFYDSDIPIYAILSHRWGHEEVSFKEMRKSDGGKKRKGVGWDKIRSTCKLATKEKFKWVWIDTCCINKDSSAELTEAINSMFKWYQRSSRCYVYLSDIHWDDCHYTGSVRETEKLRRSSWFSRGWTLQELLAPKVVIFYDMQWRFIGLKSDMTHGLAKITNISTSYLFGWKDACVAQKMRWASERQTSRVEDVAYSLLGLFDVNMPLLYGEGRKAFYRLQLEILKQSDDESIFAWVANSHVSHTGMLAQWPEAFKYSENITRGTQVVWRPPFAMTNKGLEMRIPESFIRQGGDDLHREGNSSTRREGFLTLHLNCLAVRSFAGSTAPAMAPIKFELEKLGGCWYRKAPRRSWIPHMIETEGTILGPHRLGQDALDLNWDSEKGVTIHVKQQELTDSSPQARTHWL